MVARGGITVCSKASLLKFSHLSNRKTKARQRHGMPLFVDLGSHVKVLGVWIWGVDWRLGVSLQGGPYQMVCL